MKSKNVFSASCCLCSTSTFLIITGITLLCTWSLIYQAILDINKILTPTSLSHFIWHENPIPLRIDFYFFNWTNPEDLHNHTIKPKFQQVGPYSFKETKSKTNVIWNDNGTVSYTNNKKWFFDEENSKGSLFDSVVSLNPVSLSSSFTSRYWGYFMKKSISITLRTFAPTIHLTRSVGQLLFEGAEDPLLNVASKIPFLANHLPPMDKFGWFYTRNNSDYYEGTYNMGTGTKRDDVGWLYNWKYSNVTPYYDDHCGKIGGSAGEFFPGQMTNDTIISFFSQDMCRQVALEYEKEVLVENIVGYRFSANEKFLDNGSNVPENKCYCPGDCQPSGVLNVSACRYGSPAFVSLPNFYKADPYYINSIEGLNPNKKQHDMYMVFEPTTGIPLEVAARLQLNLLLQPDPTIGLYENVPRIFFPMLWFEQIVVMPSSLAFALKLLLNMKIVLISIGIILIFAGILLKFCFYYKICTMRLCTTKQHPEDILREMVPLKRKQPNIVLETGNV